MAAARSIERRPGSPFVEKLAFGQVDDGRRPAGVRREQQRAGTEELDVVRVGRERNDVDPAVIRQATPSATASSAGATGEQASR